MSLVAITMHHKKKITEINASNDITGVSLSKYDKGPHTQNNGIILSTCVVCLYIDKVMRWDWQRDRISKSSMFWEAWPWRCVLQRTVNR